MAGSQLIISVRLMETYHSSTVTYSVQSPYLHLTEKNYQALSIIRH